MFNQVNTWLENHPRVAGWALVLVTFVLYSGSLSNGFVYDDEYQILQNPFVLNKHLWPKIFTGSVWSFQGVAFPTNYYRPLHIFCHWLIYRLAGPNPAAFHLFQVLMYAATVWLAYRVGRELLRNELAALGGALLWALHPLHVEAVAWIASVPDTGYGFFYLLGLLAFLRAEKSARNPVLAHGLAALAFFPALFFKEMALSFPLLLMAYWFFLSPGQDAAGWRTRAFRLAPYVAAVAVCVAIRIAALGYVTQSGRLWKVTPRVAGAAVALLGEHTRIFLWPTHLNVFRTFELGPSLRSPWPWVTLAVLIATLWLRKREPLPAFLIAWWAIGLAPCLDIRQLSFPLVAERFAYIPSLALCLAISWALVVWLPRSWPGAQPAQFALPALGLLMVFYAVQTARAIPNWHDNQTLADYSLQQSPNAALLHVIQAFVLQYRSGDLDGAVREYEKAMRLNASSVRPLAKVTYDSYIGLGEIAHRKGQTDAAREFFEKAVRVSPNDSPAYDALGSVFFPRGDYARSAEYFSQAVKVNPQDISAHFYLGTCWMKLERYKEAAGQFRAAREVDPMFRQAYEAEARALEAAGDPATAATVRGLAAKAQEE